MPVYPYVCPKGHEFERVRAITEDRLGIATCMTCGEIARQDYAKKNLPRPSIDGESSGYYPPEWGFPRDPKNPLKSIAPAKRKANDVFKRVEEETQGRIGAVDA